MNAQHKINRLDNRKRRIAKNLVNLEAEKTQEIIRATQSKRDPNLGNICSAMHRLQNRLAELNP